MPQGRKNQSNLSGIASQLGIAVPGLSEGESPQLYVSLLQSRQLLGAVVDSRFGTGGGGDTGAVLVDILRPARGRPYAVRREEAIDKLADLSSVETESKVALLKLSVRLKRPELAQAVNLRFLELLNEFNLHSRQSQAKEERRFSGQRVKETQQSLRDAEDQLQSFLQQNRDYRNSPLLNFQHERLARLVNQQQQQYAALVQAYEQAKLDEVRDTPVITVVEPPLIPVRPDRRNLLAKVLLAAMMGALVGVVVSLLRESWARARFADPTAMEELARSRQELEEDVRRATTAVRRVFGSRR